MVQLRAFEPGDLDALYQICLKTGDAGQDASALHNDPKVVGQIYAAPYGALEPAQSLVAEDNTGVAGYLVGTYDTDAFAAKLERDWFPKLRAHYGAIDHEALTADDWGRVSAIQSPHRDPADIVAQYPAHIHMNLLPHLRGQGVGTGLLKRWIGEARAAGVSGIHLGANAGNIGGVAFWTCSGFKPLRTVDGTTWFGMTL